MTAHCRPEHTYDDFELAAYELAGIFASRGFGTAQHREAVAALREFFENSASSPLIPCQGEEKEPLPIAPLSGGGAIPDMAEEIGRLQTAWHNAECGRDRLRALNAEMYDFMTAALDHIENPLITTHMRTILAKSHPSASAQETAHERP
jgi:hypothetical protein